MEEKPPETGDAPRGARVFRRFGGLLEPLLRYLEARGVLVSIEAQEAAQHLLRAVLRAAIAAMLAFSGWVMLMFSLAHYLHDSLGWSWAGVGFVVGLGNLLLAGLVALAAWRCLTSARWFEHTLKEFGKDRAWLGRLNDKP